MKKLLFLLALLPTMVFSQQRVGLWTVPHITTEFGVIMPSKSLIVLDDSNKIYRLTAKFADTSTMADVFSSGSYIIFDSNATSLSGHTAGWYTPLINYGSTPGSHVGSVTIRKPQGIFINGDYAYVVKDSIPSVLTIINISNPAAPLIVKSFDIPTANNGGPQYLFVQGNYVVLADRDLEGLSIIDISNPNAPVMRDSKVKNVATQGCNPLPLYVQGRYAFTGDFCGNYPGYFTVWDIADPDSIKLIGNLQITTTTPDSYAVGLKVQGNYAYIAGDAVEAGGVDDQFKIIDISDPANPTLKASVEIGNAAVDIASDIWISGSYAYITLKGAGGLNGGLQVYNVSNPLSPSLVGYHYGHSGNSIHVSGNRAYVADGSNKIYIWDISDPTNPSVVDSINGGSWRIAAQGKYLYGADYNNHRLVIYDMGGSYIQTMEAGTIKTGNLDVTNNATVGGDININGAAKFGEGFSSHGDGSIVGDLEIIGKIHVQDLLNGAEDDSLVVDSLGHFKKIKNNSALWNYLANSIDTINTPTFTTDIQSGTGTRVLVIPSGMWVEAIKIVDVGTTAGLSAIEATQETSGAVLITGKAVGTGTSGLFTTISDHQIYATAKNLTFTATGNSADGMSIVVFLRK